jgi:hypothetical protein
MKKERNFKIRIHNLDLTTTTFFVAAEDHAEVFRRFSGIIRNKGYVESRSYWRGYHQQINLHNYNRIVAMSTRQNCKTRTYYFMPVNTQKSAFRLSYSDRVKIEVAMEVTKLK